MPQPHLRAADTDRAAVAAVLGEHMSAGRLTLDEYDERLTRAYAARTFGELDQLTADLPEHRPAQRRARAARRRDAGAGRPHRRAVPGTAPTPNSWRSWLSTSLIVIAIWATISLASWELLYFWPVWVIGPWGAVLLAQTLTGRGDNGEKPRQLGT